MSINARITIGFVMFVSVCNQARAERLMLASASYGKKNPQIFEITRDKKVAWQFNRYDVFGKGLACSQVLGAKESALVRTRLATLGASSSQYGAKRTAIEIGPHKAFILQPTKPTANGSRPWVWYAPTIGSHPNQANGWVLGKLLDDGFHVAGINVGESYGSPAGRKTFSEFHAHVVREYKLEPKARLLG